MLLVLCAADDFVAALRFPVDGSIVIRADPNVDVFSDTTDHTAVLPPTWRCCRRHRRHSTPGPRAQLCPGGVRWVSVGFHSAFSSSVTADTDFLA